MIDRRHVLGLAAALALGACATGPEISSQYDRSVNYAGLHTYTWAAAQPHPGVDPLTWQRVHDAIDTTLLARGYTQATPGDFAVGFTLGSRQKIQDWDLGPYYGGWGRWGDVGWFGGAPDITTYTEGTLSIDIFDVATKRPIWHGVASQPIDTTVSEAEISTAVQGVLARFPPHRTGK